MSATHSEVEHIIHRRAGHVVVAYDKYLIMWGGYMEMPHVRHYNLNTPSNSVYHSSIDVWFYDPLLDTWTRKISHGDVPLQLSGSCAAIHDQDMYVFGGYCTGDDSINDGNYNTLWKLHIPTLTWTLLQPEGSRPFRCDKAACWVHNNRFYIFGGFGPSLEFGEQPPVHVNFVQDSGNDWNSRGWIDQLVYYDIASNMWVWPKTNGLKPSPRAAHAVDITGDKVFISGGRFMSGRMNDLYCLDLSTMTWSDDLNNGLTCSIPEGRSWHTFNFVSPNKAVLYGGFNSFCQVLSDVWVLDVRQMLWHQRSDLSLGPRLWHSAGVVGCGELLVHGGIRNNLLDSRQYKDHAEELLSLRFSPPTLKRLVVEALCNMAPRLVNQWILLPYTLQKVLQTRLSGKVLDLRTTES